jgi:hypothetical protein
MSESLADAVNATDGSVADTLQEALTEAERQEWKHVMVIGLRGDEVLVRTVTLGMPFHTKMGMSGWAHALDCDAALDIEHQEPDL